MLVGIFSPNINITEISMDTSKNEIPKMIPFHFILLGGGDGLVYSLFSDDVWG